MRAYRKDNMRVCMKEWTASKIFELAIVIERWRTIAERRQNTVVGKAGALIELAGQGKVW